VRFLGTFLAEDPLDAPWAVVDFLASQLGNADASCVKRYTERPKMAYEHAWEIAREFGYRGSPTRMLRLSRRRSWQRGRGLGRAAQRAIDAATAHLLERKVLLPAAGTLVELVAAGLQAGAAAPRADQGQRP